MIIESAANFRELHGAEATEQFASALRPNGGALPNTAAGLIANIKALQPLVDDDALWPQGRQAEATRLCLRETFHAALELLEQGASVTDKPRKPRRRRQDAPASPERIQEIADRALHKGRR
jgi:hypothetical protein